MDESHNNNSNTSNNTTTIIFTFANGEISIQEQSDTNTSQTISQFNPSNININNSSYYKIQYKLNNDTKLVDINSIEFVNPEKNQINQQP